MNQKDETKFKLYLKTLVEASKSVLKTGWAMKKMDALLIKIKDDLFRNYAIQVQTQLKMDMMDLKDSKPVKEGWITLADAQED